MNVRLKNFIAASAAVLMVSLAACFGGGSSSTADSGITQAQFDSLLGSSTTFKQLSIVGFAKGQSPAEMASHVSTNAVMTEAAAPNPCSNLGVVVSSNPSSSSVTLYRSCTGYTYNGDDATGNVQSMPAVFYDTAGCHGTAYLPGPGISVGSIAVPDATVLVSAPNVTPLAGHVLVDVNGNQLELKAGTTVTQPAIVSEQFQGSCQTFGYTGQPFFLLQAYSITDSGVPQSPYAIPVTHASP